MEPLGHNRYGPKIGRLCPFKEGDLGPRRIQYGRAEAYLRAKFHLDQCDRLATIYQRHRQDRRDRQTDNGPIG